METTDNKWQVRKILELVFSLDNDKYSNKAILISATKLTIFCYISLIVLSYISYGGQIEFWKLLRHEITEPRFSLQEWTFHWGFFCVLSWLYYMAFKRPKKLTRECSNCKNLLSKKAKVCPQCATPTTKPKEIKVKYKNCRACGTSLVAKEYKVKYVEDGKPAVDHTPCPKCGEPKPLWSPLDNVMVKLLLCYILIELVVVVTCSADRAIGTGIVMTIIWLVFLFASLL